MRTISAALLVTLSLGLPDAVAQDAGFKVVVSPSNAARSLPRAQVSQMFMRKLATWPDGKKVVPIDQAEASSLRSAFSKEIHRQATSVIKAYWVRQVFSGRLVPPAELMSDAEVLAFVKANPGAIGYVAANTPTSGVTVLEVVGDEG